jgi:single-strand DNA-binding protein
MAKSLNRVQLIGNLGQDPEVRSTANGKSVCNFNIATTESYKDQSGNWQDTTDWHRIVMWDYLADNAAKNLRKGSKIFVEGKLKTRSYEQNGVTKYITEIVANNMVMMGASQGGGGDIPPPTEYQGGSVQNQSQGSSNMLDDDDDVPF